MPTAHASQLLAPVPAWKVPAAQRAQAALPAALYLPVTQAVQMSEACAPRAALN